MPATEDLPDHLARAVAWVEATVGPVVAVEQQARWRPSLYLDVEADGRRQELYFRGDRPETQRAVGDGGIAQEHGVLRLLEDRGLPVPRLVGFCPEPEGILMERSPGRPDLSSAVDEAERRQVLDQYLAFLAELHAIAPADAAGLGLRHPDGSEQVALADLDEWERRYREQRWRPEPLIELVLRWVRTHVPDDRHEVCLLHGDAGQFLFEDGRMTAVLDFELAALGDPLADLGALLLRDLSEPLGDLRRAMVTYQQLAGRTVDPDVVAFHAVRFGICTPMGTAGVVGLPLAMVSWPQYESWYRVVGRVALQILARREGIDLDPPDLPELDAPSTSPALGARWLVEALAASADGHPIDSTERFEADMARRGAVYGERALALAEEMEAADLDDAAAFLGHRPADAGECAAALEELAAEAWPRSGPAGWEADLVRCLHRRALRQEHLLGPALRELEGVHAQDVG